MKVLIGCEFSGTVRDAFIARGHDAMSCDLLPTEKPGPHFQGDVFEAIGMQKWDLAIFHPPCTYLTVSANKWMKDQPPRKSGALVGAARREAQKEAIEFFMKLWNCDIPRIAIENPIGVMSTVFRKPDQVVQPWQFGDDSSKSTCLWLRGLQPLRSVHIVKPRIVVYGGKNYSASHYRDCMGLSMKEWQTIRSKTFPGIASAMADQWGAFVSAGFKATLF